MTNTVDPSTWPTLDGTTTWEPPTASTGPSTGEAPFIGPLPIAPFTPKKPTLAPATPAPLLGNAIKGNPPQWSKILILSLVVGLVIWLVEQNVSSKYAMIIAVILLLGAAYSYKNFLPQLQSITGVKP